MGETSIESEVESNRLKTNICIWVFLSDCRDNVIVELLEFEPFSYAR